MIVLGYFTFNFAELYAALYEGQTVMAGNVVTGLLSGSISTASFMFPSEFLFLVSSYPNMKNLLNKKRLYKKNIPL